MTIDLRLSQLNYGGSSEISSSSGTTLPVDVGLANSTVSLANRVSISSTNSLHGDISTKLEGNLDESKQSIHTKRSDVCIQSPDAQYATENNQQFQPQNLDIGNRFSVPQKVGQIPVPYRMVMDESHSVHSQDSKRIQKYRQISRDTVTNGRIIYPDNRTKILPSSNSSMMIRHPSITHSEEYDDDKDERQGLSHNGPTKGLRQFSLRVCKKVEERGVTSYNEVADELVRDLGREIGKGDQKNIRRRVYDALNVLMAMEIIRKEKKEIIWLGLPNGLMQDLEMVRKEKQSFQNRIIQKKKILQEMILRQTSLKNLIQRNKIREDQYVSEAVSNGLDPSSGLPSSQDILHLPFILISAPRDCRVNCEMLEDRSHYYFEFDSPFMIHEDIEILKLMGMYQASSNMQSLIISNNGTTSQPLAVIQRDNTSIPDIDPILSIFQDDTHTFYQDSHVHRSSRLASNSETDGVDPRNISPVKRTRFSAEWQDYNHIERTDITTALSSPVGASTSFIHEKSDIPIPYSGIGHTTINEHSLASDPNPELIARQKSLNRNLSLR